ncbi:MAG: hypothetical protein K6A38_09700 [Lachnospiraceae bacterium]|nr:hypothetical protein [Lachnospiraceae bacterium]
MCFKSRDKRQLEPVKIGYGCELRIEGLYIINLGEYLIIQCLYGDMRVSKRRENAPY